MMFIIAIHIHVEEGGKHDKVEHNIVLEIDDYLKATHEGWCYAIPLCTLSLK
jgi:hypothetical protein